MFSIKTLIPIWTFFLLIFLFASFLLTARHHRPPRCFNLILVSLKHGTDSSNLQVQFLWSKLSDLHQGHNGYTHYHTDSLKYIQCLTHLGICGGGALIRLLWLGWWCTDGDIFVWAAAAVTAVWFVPIPAAAFTARERHTQRRRWGKRCRHGDGSRETHSH